MKYSLSLAVLIAASILFCTPSSYQTKGKVLVLHEELAYADSFSKYLGSIRDAGFEIEEKSATDPSLHLRNWDNWEFDKLVIFASGIKAFGGALDGEAILDFVDSGRDLVLAVDNRVSDDLRNLASDLGVDFEPKGSAVIDDHDHVTMDRGHDTTLVLSKQINQVAAITGDKTITDPILYRGIGSTFARTSEQVLQVVGGEQTQYMSKVGQDFTDELQPVGKAISLVTIVQTRNDARVLISGSKDLFSDTFLQASSITTKTGKKYARSGNEQLLQSLTEWVFHERSVLKASSIRHRPSDGTNFTGMYRITDPIDFEIDILEYKDGQWQPFRASDVQLEFTMLDPHIRTFLKHNGQGTFYTSFKIPDVYGIFKFVIDYKRLGLTHLDISKQVSVRHFQHNEFERFLVAAYPYYASGFSCMLAFLVFSFVFLYHKD